jgi:RNA polymerase sigma-70 factor (ECF subfamily)
MPDTGEDELLYAWRAGDRAAGDQLMRLYYASIRRFFQLRAADVADDLTQRTFLACTEGRERVTVTVRAYLFGIARHMLLKHVEDASRREIPFDFDGPAAPSVFNPSRVIGLRQEHWLLLRALDNLPMELQQLIALFYVEELRVREIAHVLGLSTTAVTTRLSRAREALREQVAALPAPTEVRENVLADLEVWARALVPVLSELPSTSSST